MSRRIASLVAAGLVAFGFLALSACGGEPAVTPESLAKAAATAHSANGLCPVMERLVTADGGSEDYKGQKIAFCCSACVGKFRANADKYVEVMKANPAKYGYKP